MTQYIAYYRHDDGRVERLGDAQDFGCFEPSLYLYQEKLMGWPEHKVMWWRDTGSCFGLAEKQNA